MATANIVFDLILPLHVSLGNREQS